MEGISGLSLMSSHQRNVLNQMMKTADTSGTSPIFNPSPTFGFPHIMANGMGFASLGDMGAYASPYAFPSRPIPSGLPSPISPTSRQHDNVFESERKGKNL